MPDAVILGAVRTPVGRRNGALSGVHPADLLAGVLTALLERTGVDPEAVDDVIGGCVTQAGEQSTNVTRNAWLAAGLPESVPATTIDRQCGSSQQAVHFAAQGVMSGTQDLVIACGVESMTRVPMGSNVAAAGDPLSGSLQDRYDGGLVPQGLAAEIVAARYGTGRPALDELAATSHARAVAAREAGAFAREIVPVRGPDGTVLLDRDECPRPPDPAKIASLRPVFREDGVITAANASQIADGAAAVLVASSTTAARLGLRPRARILELALAGADPVEMLTAPIPATRRILDRSGLALTDVDLVEINEAFAPVPLAWMSALDVGPAWFDAHVNTRGGAIALGHPLGASGARLMTTLLHALEDGGGGVGLQTMCELGGLANATLIDVTGG